MLEWAAISFSGRSSQPRDQNCVSCIDRWFLYQRAIRQAQIEVRGLKIPTIPEALENRMDAESPNVFRFVIFALIKQRFTCTFYIFWSQVTISFIMLIKNLELPNRLYHLRFINTWPITLSYAYATISCVYVALHVCVYKERGKCNMRFHIVSVANKSTGHILTQCHPVRVLLEIYCQVVYQ